MMLSSEENEGGRNMIEVVFGDSACGSLKMAQHYGNGKYPGGAIGVIVSHSDGSKPTEEEIQTAQAGSRGKRAT